MQDGSSFSGSAAGALRANGSGQAQPRRIRNSAWPATLPREHPGRMVPATQPLAVACTPCRLIPARSNASWRGRGLAPQNRARRGDSAQRPSVGLQVDSGPEARWQPAEMFHVKQRGTAPIEGLLRRPTLPRHSAAAMYALPHVPRGTRPKPRTGHRPRAYSSGSAAPSQRKRCSSISATSPPDAADAFPIHWSPNCTWPRLQRSQPFVSR